MHSRRFRLCTFLLGILGLGFITGCNDHAPLRENANAQVNALAQAKLSELAPAEATYTGKMHMFRNNSDYDAVLIVKRVVDTKVGSSADQPSETVEVPKLTANLNFPFLDSLSTEEKWKHDDLLDPMGRYWNIAVDYGNYNPTSHVMTLPYAVSGYTQGNFGDLSGTLVNGHFVGTWYAKPLGDVASFDLVKSSGSFNPSRPR